jgi:hypothetical protein
MSLPNVVIYLSYAPEYFPLLFYEITSMDWNSTSKLDVVCNPSIFFSKEYKEPPSGFQHRPVVV